MPRRLSSDKRGPEARRPDRVGDKIAIYCGPAVLGLCTTKIFGKGPRPGFVEKMVQETPAVGRLIVPVSLMKTTMEATKSPGSQAYKDWREVAARYGR